MIDRRELLAGLGATLALQHLNLVDGSLGSRDHRFRIEHAQPAPTGVSASRAGRA